MFFFSARRFRGSSRLARSSNLMFSFLCIFVCMRFCWPWSYQRLVLTIFFSPPPVVSLNYYLTDEWAVQSDIPKNCENVVRPIACIFSGSGIERLINVFHQKHNQKIIVRIYFLIYIFRRCRFTIWSTKQVYKTK